MKKTFIVLFALFVCMGLFAEGGSQQTGSAGPTDGAYRIGEIGPAGGTIFYDKGFPSNGWQYLEAAPAVLDFTAVWGPINVNIAGAGTEVGMGQKNTEVIMSASGSIETAAQLCTKLNINGFKDWFLPSRNELDLMYNNLKKNGYGNFKDETYWSSSPSNNNNNAYVHNFGTSFKSDNYRTNANYVRAIRAFSDDGKRPTTVGGRKIYKIGEAGPAGGIIIYDQGVEFNGWRYLEAAPVKNEFMAAWGSPNIGIEGAGTDVGTGKQNTKLIIATPGANGNAAWQCSNLEVNGFKDWFLPSQKELDLMYVYLKKNKAGEFNDENYWSSSPASTGNSSASAQRFRDGRQSTASRNTTYFVRAIRSF